MAKILDDSDVNGVIIEELREELEESERKCAEYRERLDIAAEAMAEAGRIPNTPHAKWRWIEGLS